MPFKRPHWCVVVRETERDLGTPRLGEVVEVQAAGWLLGSRIPPQVVVGDAVMFDMMNATPTTLKGEHVVMLDERDVVRRPPENLPAPGRETFDELRRLRLLSDWNLARLKRMLA
jgi:co-chaperonin GroES (HSP10)